MPLESSSVFFGRASEICMRSHHTWARLVAVACVEPVQFAEEDQLVEHLHLLVQPALFRQVADAVQRRTLKRLAEQRTVPESGRVMPIIMRIDDDLAGPVRPQQPEHRARLDRERQPFDRHLGVVRLANLFRVQRWP